MIREYLDGMYKILAAQAGVKMEIEEVRDTGEE